MARWQTLARTSDRRIFKAFPLQQVTTRYSAGAADRGRPVTELLITNAPPPGTG